MQLSLQKAFLSEYNRQERFYSKHNHYATNKPTNHPLQCHKRKSTIHGICFGKLTPKERIQWNWLSLLYPTIRRNGKYPTIEPNRCSCQRIQPELYRYLLRRRLGQGREAERYTHSRIACSTPSVSERVAVTLSRMQGLWSS